MQATSRIHHQLVVRDGVTVTVVPEDSQMKAPNMIEQGKM